MNPVEAALAYAAGGRRVFPCRDKNSPRFPWRKIATTDAALIRKWWTRWPDNLIATPTGEVDVVLDVDPPEGLDTLAELGFSCWIVTPTVHTPRGGLHAHLAIPPGNIRNTTGKRGRGIGVNLDWRGLGGYIVLPGAGEYRWDPHLGPELPLAAVPPELLPREPLRREPGLKIEPVDGLSPYAEAAVDAACRRILQATAGEQEVTLNDECYSLGTLAGAGGVPEHLALRALLHTANRMRDYDPRWPWRSDELDYKVRRALAQGIAHPRRAEPRNGR